MNFFVLNLLAFYIHQILWVCDLSYQYCRSKFSSRQEYWNNLRVAIRMLFFNDFEHLLRFVADPPEIRAPWPAEGVNPTESSKASHIPQSRTRPSYCPHPRKAPWLSVKPMNRQSSIALSWFNHHLAYPHATPCLVKKQFGENYWRPMHSIDIPK